MLKEQIVIDRILNHIGEPSEAPTLSQARGPPMGEEFAQQDLFEDHVDAIPDDEIDQTEAW